MGTWKGFRRAQDDRVGQGEDTQNPIRAILIFHAPSNTFCPIISEPEAGRICEYVPTIIITIPH